MISSQYEVLPIQKVEFWEVVRYFPQAKLEPKIRLLPIFPFRNYVSCHHRNESPEFSNKELNFEWNIGV